MGQWLYVIEFAAFNFPEAPARFHVFTAFHAAYPVLACRCQLDIVHVVENAVVLAPWLGMVGVVVYFAFGHKLHNVTAVLLHASGNTVHANSQQYDCRIECQHSNEECYIPYPIQLEDFLERVPVPFDEARVVYLNQYACKRHKAGRDLVTYGSVCLIPVEPAYDEQDNECQEVQNGECPFESVSFRLVCQEKQNGGTAKAQHPFQCEKKSGNGLACRNEPLACCIGPYEKDNGKDDNSDGSYFSVKVSVVPVSWGLVSCAGFHIECKVKVFGACDDMVRAFFVNSRKNIGNTVMKELDWANLPFGYMKTDWNVRIAYKDGKWGEIEETDSEYIPIHIGATCLHYGQECFEGIKAFKGADDQVRVFRMDENAKRMQSTCRATMMPELPTETFCEMVRRVVRLNKDYIPPYTSGASLYIRPLLIGTGAEVGVKPAKEYLCIMFVMPVGPYFKGGFGANGAQAYALVRSYDRSAPLGMGKYKVGGNYAASLYAHHIAHERGYASEFYLDAKEKKYIDECGAANFIGIKGNTYITPKSESILPSITNKSLMQLAADMGLKVEQRPVPVEELLELDEAGACGTAAVIAPIQRIDDIELGTSYVISKDGQPGPVLTKLYTKLRGIQYGVEPDLHQWTEIIDVD